MSGLINASYSILGAEVGMLAGPKPFYFSQREYNHASVKKHPSESCVCVRQQTWKHGYMELHGVTCDLFSMRADICCRVRLLPPDWPRAASWSVHIWGQVLFAGPVCIVWSKPEGALALLLITMWFILKEFKKKQKQHI